MNCELINIIHKRNLVIFRFVLRTLSSLETGISNFKMLSPPYMPNGKIVFLSRTGGDLNGNLQ